MTNKLIVLAVVLCGIAALKFGSFFSGLVVNFGYNIQHSLTLTLDQWHDAYDAYLDQAQSIRSLKQTNEQLKKQVAVNAALRRDIVELTKAYNKNFVANPSLATVKVVSYAQIPSFGRFWLDYPSASPEKIYGLVYPSVQGEMLAAGIAVSANAKTRQAIVNFDPQCSFAVTVGATQAPGIAMGKNGREMVVRFIPYWISIAVGDDVVTSGLDGIFFPGVKVGKVKKINNDSAYQEAIIEPAFLDPSPSYFYLIEKL